MSCKMKVEEYLNELTTEDIIFISKLYFEKFSDYSETAFFKIMERMVLEGRLIRISKGIYMKHDEDTLVKVPEKLVSSNRLNMIMNYYFGENNDNGMYIGYQLYNKYGISDKNSDIIELYSNIVDQNSKSIENLIIRKVPVDLNYDHAKVIEALEILQNYDKIENLNKFKFAVYAKQFAQGYDNASALRVLQGMKYKKSTIAFMKNILDCYQIDNSLGKFLNCASKYKFPHTSEIKD